jgi:hypothetical protein
MSTLTLAQTKHSSNVYCGPTREEEGRLHALTSSASTSTAQILLRPPPTRPKYLQHDPMTHTVSAMTALAVLMSTMMLCLPLPERNNFSFPAVRLVWATSRIPNNIRNFQAAVDAKMDAVDEARPTMLPKTIQAMKHFVQSRVHNDVQVPGAVAAGGDPRMLHQPSRAVGPPIRYDKLFDSVQGMYEQVSVLPASIGAMVHSFSLKSGKALDEMHHAALNAMPTTAPTLSPGMRAVEDAIAKEREVILLYKERMIAPVHPTSSGIPEEPVTESSNESTGGESTKKIDYFAFTDLLSD